MRAWARRHPWKAAGLALLGLALLLNLSAFLHAWRMTHFVAGGRRTSGPRSLSMPGKLWILATGVTVPRPRGMAAPAGFTVHRFAARDGVTLDGWHSRASGPRRGLVLLFPGYAASKSLLLEEAARFARLGLDAFLVDFRGCGGSGGDVTTIGMREALDVAAAVRYARRFGDQPILYGVSMGSAAVLRAIAHEGVEPRAVILESPFDRLLTTVRNRFDAMGLPAFPAAHLLVFWGGVQHGFDGFAHDPLVYAARVRCPALVLHGARDREARPAEVEAVHSALAGPKQIVRFRGARHEALLRADTALWERSVVRFLRLPASERTR